MIPPKTQRDAVIFNSSSTGLDDCYSGNISAIGKSGISKKSLKISKMKDEFDTDFRESKTPRDAVPKLNAWDVVKEKTIDAIHEVTNTKPELLLYSANKPGKEEDHNESYVRPSFDKEMYMKHNCINNRTKLQLDQIQNKESKKFQNFKLNLKSHLLISKSLFSFNMCMKA